MKKLFFLLICSVISAIILLVNNSELNAQTLYVKNTTNQCCLDVTNIIKCGATCNGSSFCPMLPILGVDAGSSATQPYPGCTAIPDITLDIQYFDPSITMPQPFTIAYCGTPVIGTFIGSLPVVTYELYPGVGVDIILYIHY